MIVGKSFMENHKYNVGDLIVVNDYQNNNEIKSVFFICEQIIHNEKISYKISCDGKQYKIFEELIDNSKNVSIIKKI